MKRTVSICCGATFGATGRFAVCLCGLVFCGLPLNLFAVLGGSEASVQTDQAHMQASLKSSNTGPYRVHEMQTASGIVVREYAAGGTVFGVAWEGPWRPDMQQLLGSYFEAYQQALEAQSGVRHGRTPVHIALPGLVVNMGGHMRSFRGNAYIPDMLPQGVAEKEIR
ncbi:MAG TPA: DUF2844 domain-containing protein [Candidatus Solibacter sp.]|nr:DUF2844 domain-containing protein [Candidatus Solibacter sp.]